MINAFRYLCIQTNTYIYMYPRGDIMRTYIDICTHVVILCVHRHIHIYVHLRGQPLVTVQNCLDNSNACYKAFSLFKLYKICLPSIYPGIHSYDFKQDILYESCLKRYTPHLMQMLRKTVDDLCIFSTDRSFYNLWLLVVICT